MEPSIFHDESWSTPWHSPDYPPNETNFERCKRQRAMSDWKCVPPFLGFQSYQSGGWPWGWAIYRTSYVKTSDEDWARAIEKLDQACLADLESSERCWFESGKSHIHETREGYRNVIFEDPALEGASEAVIRTRHIQGVESHGLRVCSAVPRLNYCLLLDDRCIRSILASTAPKKLPPPPYQLLPQDFQHDPKEMVGYVNVIDAEFDPENPQNECGEYYRGLVRLHLDCLFTFAGSCDTLMTEQEWGEYGMEIPTDAVYIDGPHSRIESKEMFLSSPKRFYGKGESVTEAQYSEGQQ